MTCRTGEGGLSSDRTNCWEDEADKKKVRDLKCKEFALTDAKYTNQNNNKVIVTKGGSEASESYVKRISSTICGQPGGKGKGGHGTGGFLDARRRRRSTQIRRRSARASMSLTLTRRRLATTSRTRWMLLPVSMPLTSRTRARNMQSATTRQERRMTRQW